jgi:DNA-binding MarR family transcriptional regulator
MKSKKSYSPAGQQMTHLILETFRLNGRLLVAGDKLTKDLGLTSARWQALGAITASEVPLTVPSIARNMGLQRQSVQRIVDVLRDEGLVEFTDNPHHKKAKLVTLTSAGREVFEKVTMLQVPWINRFAEGFDPKAIEDAVTVMRTLRTRMEEA